MRRRRSLESSFVQSCSEGGGHKTGTLLCDRGGDRNTPVLVRDNKKGSCIASGKNKLSLKNTGKNTLYFNISMALLS